MIDEFDLPWNMRGAMRPVAPAPRPPSTAPQSGVASRIVDLVRRRPGMTELEIAKAIYGPGAAQQQINQHCRSLLKQGKVDRNGSGGQADPFTYRARG